jgi:hypothetical protein
MTRTQRRIDEIRKTDACILIQDSAGRPARGVAVSVEQERHAFHFGCIVPDLDRYSSSERARYRARLDETFNVVVPAGQAFDPDLCLVEIAQRVPLAHVNRRLDEFAASGRALQVHLWGESVGMTETDSVLLERAVGRRLADVYSLCFAHPAVGGIFWIGLGDSDEDARGGGLLRRDLAPKYAYKVLQKLIHFDWHTRAAALTDDAGLFRFRGFCGTYRALAHLRAPDPLVSTITIRHGSGSCTLAETI